MKKLPMLIAFGLITFSMTSTQGKEVDISKFCIDKFCLGDPASKFGGVVSLKKLVSQQTWLQIIGQGSAEKFPLPNCESLPKIHIYPQIKRKNITSIRIAMSAFPKYLNDGVDSYYRITEIEVRFPKVSPQDLEQLKRKIFNRAGIEEDVLFKDLFGGWHWYLMEGSEYGGIPIDGISISRSYESKDSYGLELSLKQNFVSGEIRMKQKGCVQYNSPPDL